MLAGDDAASDPTTGDTDMEMKRQAEQKMFPWMVMVHDILEM